MKTPSLSPQAKSALGLAAIGITFNVAQYLLQEAKVYSEGQLTATANLETDSPVPSPVTLRDHARTFLNGLNPGEIAARIFEGAAGGLRSASRR